MVSRRRRRPMKSRSRMGAEFFKFYIPHLHSEQLLIPPDFIKYFSRTISDKVILKDISGKKWHVDVGKLPDGVFLKNGWQTFVSHNSLKVGEFLHFRYDGNYSFVVKVFGTNGCKNGSSFAAKNIESNVKIEEETEAKPIPNQRACPNEEGATEGKQGLSGFCLTSNYFVSMDTLCVGECFLPNWNSVIFDVISYGLVYISFVRMFMASKPPKSCVYFLNIVACVKCSSPQGGRELPCDT